MHNSERSHRRAVWTTIVVVLLIVVVLAGYELNWIWQRHAALAEFAQWYPQVEAAIAAAGVRVDRCTMAFSAKGPGYADELVIWALDEPMNEFQVLCPKDDAKLLATYKGGDFPWDAIEELDQVRRARWLFPDAEVSFAYFRDAGSNLILDPVRNADAHGRAKAP